MLIKDPFRPSAACACFGLDVHPMTLLEELQARILAKADRENESRLIEAKGASAMSSRTEELIRSAGIYPGAPVAQ